MSNLLSDSFKLFKLAVVHNRKTVLYTLIVVILECISVACLYKLNGVYGELYQAIQEYKPNQIWHAIWIFCGVAGILVVINGYLGAFVNRLAFEIREGLTIFCCQNLTNLAAVPYLEQKIQEDLRKFGESSCDFWSALFKALIKLPIFLGVVVSLTHWYTGLIILATVILGTYLTKVVGMKLVPLQAEQESNEALFRTSLKDSPSDSFNNHFSTVRTQFYKINSKLKLLSFTQSGLGQAFTLLPFIVLMPLYISKSVTMGQFFQSVNALSKIVDSLVILIDSRQVMVNIESSTARLNFLTKS